MNSLSWFPMTKFCGHADAATCSYNEFALSTQHMRWIEVGIPGLAAVAGVAVLVVWTGSYFAPVKIKPRALVAEVLPGATATAHPDRVANTATVSTTPAPAAAGPAPSATPVAVPAIAGDWPNFRGPNHDNIGDPNVHLPNDLKGIRMLWSTPVGEGYAAPVVKNGRVYLLDYDAQKHEDALRCFSLADGKEVWRSGYPVDIKRNHGISRTIPATDGKYVVTIGPKCNLACFDALTGQAKWKTDLVSEYGTTVPEWYAGQCPLIEDGKVIIAPGGKALMVAFDLATGKPIWKTPNPRGWKMTHSSIAVAKLGGQRTYVYCGTGGVAGVSATNGQLLWDTTEWVVSTATVPTPVPIDDRRIFLCGGYNSGAMMLAVTKTGATWSARKEYALPSEVFGSDQQTPVFYEQNLYGVAPNGEMVCLDLSGKRRWSSGTQGRFGLGPYLIADKKIFAMNDNGALTLADALPTAYHALGKVRLLAGRESWGPVALAGNRLLARDQSTLVCVQLGG